MTLAVALTTVPSLFVWEAVMVTVVVVVLLTPFTLLVVSPNQGGSMGAECFVHAAHDSSIAKRRTVGVSRRIVVGLEGVQRPLHP